MRHVSWLVTAAAVTAGTLAVTGFTPQSGAAGAHTVRAPRAAGPVTGAAAGNPFCKQLGKHYQASSGAQMFCFGAHLQPGEHGHRAAVPETGGVAQNVNAARPGEDVSPAGVAAQGQSEVSIAAAGNDVVEAWNDSTGFVSTCPAPMSKEESTGLGFSADGGKTFTDLGGLPNPGCKQDLYFGDPSVTAYRAGGQTWFYISSLYDSPSGLGASDIAFDACKVIGSGASATLSCGKPVIAATSTNCQIIKLSEGGKIRTERFCSFLDKDFMTVDPAHGKLYVSYSDFIFTKNGGNPVDVAVCDIGNRAGGRGPVGGTPGAPVCEHGTPLKKSGKNMLKSQPYFRAASTDPRGCENEGAYPAVDTASGALFVAYEYNWASSLFFAPCMGAKTPVMDVMTRTAAHCLQLKAVSPCQHPTQRSSVPVVSMEGVIVPGYSRFPLSDFPRLAVSDRLGTVSMVWNDVRHHPFGDILMQSFNSKSLHPVQAAPVVLDRPHQGGLAFLPALRYASKAGLLDVTWFSRAGTRTPDTDVMAALGVSPLAHTTPANTKITNTASNWVFDSSLINPNFGDYTDNAISATATKPYTGSTLFVAWSDGRLGIPQPFEAHLPAK